MTVNQISIFLENKYGKLSEILALLAEERIRIIAATVLVFKENRNLIDCHKVLF